MSLPVTEHGGGGGGGGEVAGATVLGGWGSLDAFYGIFFLGHPTWEVQWTDTGIATLPLVSKGAALRCNVTSTAQEIMPLLFLDSLNRSKNNTLPQFHLLTFIFSCLH